MSTPRPERADDLIQIIILLLIAVMAGAASFTHVHDWTMRNVPAGTGGWFGWVNAVISELTPTPPDWRSADVNASTGPSPTR